MASKEEILDAERLKSLLRYEPNTGAFTWLPRGEEQFTSPPKCKRWNTRYAGKQAGWALKSSRNNCAYVAITITLDGVRCTYYAHRLAWLYITGEWPSHQVDHRDLDGLNNRWSNLRLATGGQNQANRLIQSNNAAGFKGISENKNGSYRARIQFNGKLVSLGTRTTKEEAAALYDAAAKRLHGEYSRGNSL